MIILRMFDNDIIFHPLLPMSTMLPYVIVLALIVLINRRRIITRLLILALLLIISQRPMLKDKNEITYNMNLDILFVIDNTVSMHAEDVNGKLRLDAVKEDCKKIMEKFAGASFALITYANIAQVKYPFTTESSTIEDIIDRLKIIDPVYAEGSSLDLPYEYMKILLESSDKKDKHRSIVFFIGDGELTKQENEKTNVDKYSDLKELINGGAVLGYGSTEGAKVKITESINKTNIVDSSNYLLDASTNPPKVAISKLNEENLKKVASNLSIDYYHMTDFTVLEKNLDKIRDGAIEDENDDKQKMDKDIYYYFSGGLIVLLLLELFHYRRDEQ